MPEQTAFPAPHVPVTEEDGSASETWFDLWQRLWRRTGGSGGTLGAEDITVAASPFDYESDRRGSVVVSGGTVSDISLVRGSDTVALGVVAGAVPVLAGDTIRVTYTGAPIMTFLPSEVL